MVKVLAATAAINTETNRTAKVKIEFQRADWVDVRRRVRVRGGKFSAAALLKMS
jgi:hypothetical protein